MTAPDNPHYRDTQLALIEGMERPCGPILQSVFTGSNADLMSAVAPLYLTGSVLDVTYGEGRWWERFKPDPFVAHDLYKLDGVDFRDLPHIDQEFDTVAYDPPYNPSGGASSAAIADSDFQNRYGIGHNLTGVNVERLILDGLPEVCRVARRFVLVKCMEFASGTFRDVPTMVTNSAADLGWIIHDRIVHHTGPGPGGHNIFIVKRARRAHSYLLVFAR